MAPWYLSSDTPTFTVAINRDFNFFRGDLEEHQGDSEDDFNEEEWQDNEELQDPEDFLD